MLYVADPGNPMNPNVKSDLKPLLLKSDVQYSVIGVEKGNIFIQTTLDAPRGRIVSAEIKDIAPSNWKVIVPETDGVIQGASFADGSLLVNYLTVAKSKLELFSLDGKSLGTLDFNLWIISSVSARENSNEVYYSFTSFLYPTTIFKYNVESGKTSVFFKPKVYFNPAEYQTRQIFYPSKDGTKIPLFIVAKKDLKLDGNNPTILYGYGGFNITITPHFNPMLITWLELGGVYAVANLRGGGTYGEKWHEAGMLGNKQNVFDDFAWAAKYLINQKYTRPKRLGIQGYSNGGLLIGASITQHPELFGAAYAGAGVIDMLRYQKFSGGGLWSSEYGTSADKKAFKWLYAYSPLANIKKGVCYPPTIITTATMTTVLFRVILISLRLNFNIVRGAKIRFYQS